MAKLKTKWSVYTIVNTQNEIEYIGCTSNPKRRWYNHTYWYQGSGIGKFYGRTDVKMEVVKEFDNRREGWDYEAELKLQHGFELTEESATNMDKVSVKVYCANTGKELGIYRSIMEASRKLNVGFRSISANIKGRSKVVDRKYQFKALVN